MAVKWRPWVRSTGWGLGQLRMPAARAPRPYLRCAPTELRLRRISALSGNGPLPEGGRALGGRLDGAGGLARWRLGATMPMVRGLSGCALRAGGAGLSHWLDHVSFEPLATFAPGRGGGREWRTVGSCVAGFMPPHAGLGEKAAAGRVRTGRKARPTIRRRALRTAAPASARRYDPFAAR